MERKKVSIRLAVTLPNHKVQFANMRVEVGMEHEFDESEFPNSKVIEDEISEQVWERLFEECKAAREMMEK